MKQNNTVLLIAEIAVVTSLALVFDYIAQFYSFKLFPNGGSISFAMLPVFVIALRRGVVPGIVSGLLLGFLQTILMTPYIAPLNPVVGYFLDYPIGYGLVGLAGLTRHFVQSENRTLGIVGVGAGVLIGGLLRTLSVTVSGVYCWLSSWWGSIAYNFPYMIPSIIVCGALAIIIYIAAPKVFVVEYQTKEMIDLD